MKGEIRNQEVLALPKQCNALLSGLGEEKSRALEVNMKIKRFSEILSALILDCQSRGSVSGICIRILRVGTRNHQSLTSITESDRFELK